MPLSTNPAAAMTAIHNVSSTTSTASQNPKTTPMNFFTLIKMLRFVKERDVTRKAGDNLFKWAVKRVINLTSLIACLSSLSRSQCSMASQHILQMCLNGPDSSAILIDCGVCPALVSNLFLEGSRNVRIVAEALMSIRHLCKHHEACIIFSEMDELPEVLNGIYRGDNKVLKEIVASIVSEIFSVLGEGGEGAQLVRKGVRVIASSSSGNKNGDGTSNKENDEEDNNYNQNVKREPLPLLSLFLHLLSSPTPSIILPTLTTLETLTYHFPNVTLLCSLEEPFGILTRLLELLKRTEEPEVVSHSSRIVSNIVCNSRLDPNVLYFSRSQNILGQLHAINSSFMVLPPAAKEDLHAAIFDMHCALPREKVRSCGPNERREATIVREQNR